MERSFLEGLLYPALDRIETISKVAGTFVDKDQYRIYLAQLWVTIVTDLESFGLQDEDLEPTLETINRKAQPIVGNEEAVIASFRFATSDSGAAAMDRMDVSKYSRELILYFASVILDPAGHRRWMDEIQNKKNAD